VATVNSRDLHVKCCRLREEQHLQVLRRRQEMEREAAATLTKKAAGDTGSTQRLDELATTSSGRMNTRQNPADDRTVREELMEKLKLR